MLQSLATFLGEVIAITAAVMLPLAGLAVIAAQIFTYVHGPYAKPSSRKKRGGRAKLHSRMRHAHG
ncbi:MAG: hypothetical protein V4601_05925 [Pseudomonadota bacterium]